MSVKSVGAPPRPESSSPGRGLAHISENTTVESQHKFDSRVAILSFTIVILAGTFLTSRVDLEEGIRVAEEEDARAYGLESSSDSTE